MLEDILGQLGFGVKETSLYKTLLTTGGSKAGELARLTGINRTTVYDLLGNLLEKGIVSKSKQGASTYFVPQDPAQLLRYIDREIEETQVRLEKQKERVASLLPELQSLRHQGTDKPVVTFFEGEKGMREAYEDTLTSREPILAYANVQTMHEGLPNFFPNYYKRRADADVFIRAILPQNDASLDRADRDKQELRRTRFLPKGKQFSPEVNVYDDKVLIASWKEKMAVIIESKEFAEFQKMLFHELWETLPTKEMVKCV